MIPPLPPGLIPRTSGDEPAPEPIERPEPAPAPAPVEPAAPADPLYDTAPISADAQKNFGVQWGGGMTDATNGSAPVAPADGEAPPYPEMVVPSEVAYRAVAVMDPDRTANVMSIAKKTGQDENFVDKNYEVARKAAAMHTQEYLADLEVNYPVTAAFLSDPRNMAVAHDDIDSLIEHQEAIDRMGKVEWTSRLLGAGTAKLGAFPNRFAGILHSAYYYYPNLWEKGSGRPELQTPKELLNNDATRFWEDLASKIAPIESTWSPAELAMNGEFSKAGKALMAQVIINAPSQAILLASGAGGAGPSASRSWASRRAPRSSPRATPWTWPRPRSSPPPRSRVPPRSCSSGPGPSARSPVPKPRSRRPWPTA